MIPHSPMSAASSMIQRSLFLCRSVRGQPIASPRHLWRVSAIRAKRISRGASMRRNGGGLHAVPLNHMHTAGKPTRDGPKTSWICGH
jgi:hypothetical protein